MPGDNLKVAIKIPSAYMAGFMYILLLLYYINFTFAARLCSKVFFYCFQREQVHALIIQTHKA